MLVASGDRAPLEHSLALNVLEPNPGYIFFQNNQQANGIEGEQQSENVQEVIKNSN